MDISASTADAALPNCSRCLESFLREEDGPALRCSLNPLIGDAFFKYTCSKCTGELASFERLPLSWINVIQLALYHLHQSDKSGVGYFRWKEDICQLIEGRWDTLLPHKSRTASWMNSVSSVLSANSSTFVSGFEKLKQPGWWALRNVRPPKPASGAPGETKRKRRKTEEDDSAEPPSRVVEGRQPIPIPSPGGPQRSSFQFTSTVSGAPPLPTRSPLTMDTAQTLLLAKHYVDRIPNVSALLPLEQEATPTTVRAAQEIKRKLVERLLRVDSKLLQEALANAPAPPPIGTTAVASPSPIASGATSGSNSGAASGSLSETTSPTPLPSNLEAIRMASSLLTTPPATLEGYLGRAAVVSSAMGKIGPSRKELKRLHKAYKPPNYVRASPHENELLELCLRVISPNETLNRFKRKLIMRRAKRRAGLPIFDIDQMIYKYLKSAEPLLLQAPPQFRKKMGLSCASSVPSAGEAAEGPQTFFDIPYHRDAALSFKAKLLGVSNLSDYLCERVSPFTGLRLVPFLHREGGVRPLKLRLLRELRQRVPPYDGEGAAIRDTAATGAMEDTIDFVHVRKEWLPQVNRLLRDFFWPSVDMIDSLDYPDYGVLVMYRKLVVGCAFMTPDAYMTYFLIHPEWSGAGLGTLLLHLMVSKASPPHLDITLHVSATNPAMLLYQKFGFKPEEYIVNFYDKYYRDDGSSIGQMHRYSKNAFLIRYRRR